MSASLSESGASFDGEVTRSDHVDRVTRNIAIDASQLEKSGDTFTSEQLEDLADAKASIEAILMRSIQ